MPAHHRERTGGESGDRSARAPSSTWVAPATCPAALGGLAYVDDRSAADVGRAAERGRGDVAPGRAPGVDAAGRLTHEVLVADVAALADDLAAVLVV